MPNESEGKNTTNDSKSDPIFTNVVTPKQGYPGIKNAEASDSDFAAAETKRELHWLEKLNFAGQFCLVIVGIIAASIYGCQLSVMRGTLEEMKRSGEQSTEQTWSAIGNLNWMARSMDWSQKETLKGIESSERTSRKSLDATIAQFQQDQRAWIGISNADFSVENNTTIKTVLDVRNVGKTPGFNIKGNTDLISRARGYQLKISDIAYTRKDNESGAIFPNQGFLLSNSLYSAESQITNTLNYLKSGSQVMYIFGTVSYDDAFGVSHWTHSCVFMEADLKSTHPCNIYNDTDYREKKTKRHKR